MNEKNITLILGGARSGKSTFAEKIALDFCGKVTYFATADCRDSEMESRIKIHKSRRPASWETWEGNPLDLPEAVKNAKGLLLLDCLTMWLTRLFLSYKESEETNEDKWREKENEIMKLVKTLCENVGEESHMLAVSNEVGFGLVPPYLMGRRFRDMQGRANQLAASYAKNVSLVVAGCPIFAKGAAPDLSYITEIKK